MKRKSFALVVVALLSQVPIGAAQDQLVKLEQEPACQTLQPAAVGGPLPKSSDVLLVRYLGRANFEVAYRGKVLLLDTYYDNSRLPYVLKFGLKESD